MTVTIYDVAREARVSMATVSRVVNGNQNVKPETRDKVKSLISSEIVPPKNIIPSTCLLNKLLKISFSLTGSLSEFEIIE